MPKILEIDEYKFGFYSNENQEPAHVHINKGTGNAKYWLEPEVAEKLFIRIQTKRTQGHQENSKRTVQFFNSKMA